MNNWISIKDRLPPSGEYVLVANANDLSLFGVKIMRRYGGMIYSGGYVEFEWQEDNCDDLGGEITWSRDKVTHWMPLPKPPIKQENNNA